MLPSKLNFVTCTNVFGEIQTTHKSLGSSRPSSRGQTPIFHTLGFKQRIEVELDEHIRVANMFQQATQYSVRLTNILFKLYDLEIKNKHIIKEKDKSIQNLQGALQKGQKLKAKL